jgi:hypothetical protein
MKEIKKFTILPEMMLLMGVKNLKLLEDLNHAMAERGIIQKEHLFLVKKIAYPILKFLKMRCLMKSGVRNLRFSRRIFIDSKNKNQTI